MLDTKRNGVNNTLQSRIEKVIMYEWKVPVSEDLFELKGSRVEIYASDDGIDGDGEYYYKGQRIISEYIEKKDE